jgi:hypothetical protein
MSGYLRRTLSDFVSVGAILVMQDLRRFQSNRLECEPNFELFKFTLGWYWDCFFLLELNSLLYLRIVLDCGCQGLHLTTLKYIIVYSKPSSNAGSAPLQSGAFCESALDNLLGMTVLLSVCKTTCRSQRPRVVSHELSSSARTQGS